MVEDSSNTSFAARLAMFNKKKDDTDNVETRTKSRTLYQKSSIKIEEKIDFNKEKVCIESNLDSKIDDKVNDNNSQVNKTLEVLKSKSQNESDMNTFETKKEVKKIKFNVKENEVKNNNFNTNSTYIESESKNDNKPLEKKDSKKDLSDRKSMFNFENTKNNLNEMFKKRMTVKSSEDENNKLNNSEKKDTDIIHNKKDNENNFIEQNNKEMSYKTQNNNYNSNDLTVFKTNVISKNKISKPKFDFPQS